MFYEAIFQPSEDTYVIRVKEIEAGQSDLRPNMLLVMDPRGEAITVYGDGSQSRCFCDVRDVVQAIIQLARFASGHVRV